MAISAGQPRPSIPSGSMAPSISISPDAATKAAFLSTSSLPTSTTRTITNRGAAVLPPPAAEQARYYAKAVCAWYYNTLDPYVAHSRNVESRLRHPLHVVTRRILYGNVELDCSTTDNNTTAGGGGGGGGNDDGDLETLFNDDDDVVEILMKDGESLTTRRSWARLEAFLASCAAAIREDNSHHAIVGDGTLIGTVLRQQHHGGSSSPIRKGGGGKPQSFRQIDLGDLLLRLEVYCRTLRRIRFLSDNNPTLPMEECIIHHEPRKQTRARIGLIVQTYLRNVDCVRDVHTTLMTLILTATLEVLAVEVWCPELRATVDKLASEYEHKVSFASLAFLSSPDTSADTHLVPLLTRYFQYLQTDWKALVFKCELERMLRAVLDADLRQHFKSAVFHSVGHILDDCRRNRTKLDNIAIPPPWKEGVFGMSGGGGGGDGGGVSTTTTNVIDIDLAIQQYISDPTLVKQALRDLRREVITINGQVLPPADSHQELAAHLGLILHSNKFEYPLSPRRGASAAAATTTKKKKGGRQRRASNYASDIGIEYESSDLSGTESDTSTCSKVDVGLVDALAIRILIAVSRTGAGGDAYFIVSDLFGGEEVEVVPTHHTSSSGKVNQGTIEIIVKLSSITIKSHAKFDIYPKPIVSESDALIQFHTTTTETIALQQSRVASFTTLKEKKSNMTGWRTLAIRPAFYEKIPSR